MEVEEQLIGLVEMSNPRYLLTIVRTKAAQEQMKVRMAITRIALRGQLASFLVSIIQINLLTITSILTVGLLNLLNQKNYRLKFAVFEYM